MTGQQRWRVWSCDAHLIVTDAARLDAARRTADARLREVGDACDRFRTDSELQSVPTGVAHRVSPMLARLVRGALDAAERTEGRCDPTLGADLRALGYDRDIDLVMAGDRPARVVVRRRPRWRSVRLEGDVLTVPPGVELDLGATAKATAADLIARDVADGSGCGVLMNLGGDVATAGPAPAGGWQVLVQDLPRDPAARIGLLPGWALATSSTQRRRWTQGGVQRHHVVDPATGLPADPVWRTASVVAPTAAEANARATAALVAGTDAPRHLERTGLAARLVAADGSVRLLGGWPAETGAAA